MKILHRIGLAAATLAMVLTCSAFSGCALFGGTNMPAPNNPQTAVYEARASLGISEFMLNKYYLRTADCTSPLTVLPCKNFAIALSIQSGIKYAHDTVAGAEDTVRNPAFDASTSGAVITAMQEAVKLLEGWRKNPAVAATAKHDLANPTAADISEAKAVNGSGQKAPAVPKT